MTTDGSRLLSSVNSLDADIQPAGARDHASVDKSGQAIDAGIEGVELVRLTSHCDHRGSLMEVYDPSHPFWSEPIVYSYCVTVRPGRIKGWGMHRKQADRYFVATGSMRVVLYDGRTDSPSFKHYAEFHFTDASPGLLRIPPGVWHADQNWGDDDVLFVNFPTQAYNHADPDKYRIDPHSGEIPFDWELKDG